MESSLRVAPFLRERLYMLNIFAGIIVYNPDMNKLRDNISSVVNQVSGLILVDNGSDNIASIKSLISEFEDHIILIENSENKGVAYALNQIMKYSYKSGANWVLTLDDDSECYPELISMYREFIESNQIHKLASVSCLREDRKYNEHNTSGISKKSKNHMFIGGADQVQYSQDYSLVDTCITSGNLVSVEAWRTVKGFNNKLFIDMVDDDFCFRLRAAGYNIARINRYGFLHELGNDIIKVKIFGREKTVFAYSLKRKYYTARNVRYMIRTYKLGLFNEYSSYLAKRIIGTLLYEKNKYRGIMAYVKGYIAGKNI